MTSYFQHKSNSIYGAFCSLTKSFGLIGPKNLFRSISLVLALLFSLGFVATVTAEALPVASTSVDKLSEKLSSKSGAGVADIRMLIDISGSMKKNDPSNLRIPAVNLLTELIPDGDKAGVWTFGQWVNNLIRAKVVDDAWRLDAKEKAKQINSVALYTNIGAVLEKASDDFKQKDKDFSNTHFILLTDGMVDIDKDPVKNSTERDRILTTLLQKFKEKGAKIHAVSLSKNADTSLMDKLAIQTGGQSAVAETSDDLTKVFLQALQQAVPSEQVPIEGNEFVIDSSIEEFTALIFRGKGDVPTEIISPDESVYNYSNKGGDVKWYQDQGYDLITVSRPLEGTWKIKSEIQPDSQVTVVSNLQLNVTKLPVNFYAGEHLDIAVSFVEDGSVVTKPEFLSLLDVSLQLMTESNKTATKTISKPDQPPIDGVFKDSIRKLTKIGRYEITVLVDGKTFKRKKKQVINLRAPFDFEFSVRGEGDKAYYELVVSPMNESISVKDTNIFAKVNSPDGGSLINALDLDEASGRWKIAIRPDKGDGLYTVTVKVKATTIDGKRFKFKPKPFEAEFPIPTGASQSIVSVNEPDEEASESESESESEPEPEPEPEVVEDKVEEVALEELESSVEEDIVGSDETVDLVGDDTNAFWLLVGGGVLVGLLLLGGLAFYLMKKRKASSDDKDEEILSDEDVEDIAEEVSAPVVEEPEVDIPVVKDDLDFVEDPEVAVIEEPEEIPVVDEVPVIEELDEDLDDGALDLSSDDLSDVVEDLSDDGVEDIPTVDILDEEVDADDIAQAIEDGANEQEEDLSQEIEAALDISEPDDDDDDDDDDEEFNLEDFDIGDTDGLPEDEK
jgi:uncharacterized protein (TIGR03503 family)